MPRGRPRKNPDDVLIRSAELIGAPFCDAVERGTFERELGEWR